MGEFGQTLFYIGAGAWILLLAATALPVRRFYRFSGQWQISASPERVWSIYDFDPNNPESRAFHSYIVSFEETQGNPHVVTTVCDLSGSKDRLVKLQYEVIAERPPKFSQMRTLEMSGQRFPFGERNLQTVELHPVQGGTCVTFAWEGELKTLGQRHLLRRNHNLFFKRLKSSCEGKSIKPYISRRRPFASIVLSILAIASFGIAFGWAFGLILSVVLVIHEFGHWLAMRMTGQPAPRVMLLPFLGGVTIANHPHKTYFNDAFCALMGAGFSAVLALPLLLLMFRLYPSAGPSSLDHGIASLIAKTALIIGSLNLLQLLPFLPLDGGQVLRAIMQSFSARWAKYVLLAIGAIGIAACLYVNLPLLAGIVGIGVLQSWHMPVVAGTARPMSSIGVAAMIGLFLLTVAIHVITAALGAALMHRLN
jgi:Zn-dependent protease